MTYDCLLKREAWLGGGMGRGGGGAYHGGGGGGPATRRRGTIYVILWVSWFLSTSETRLLG